MSKDNNRSSDTQYILSLSYGKDSIAMIEACRQLHYPVDRIITAEVWATDTIHADLPPMVEFKAKADKIIKERYGIEVEHVCATKNGEKLTYEKLFYRIPKRKRKNGFGDGTYLGFPFTKGAYCNDRLKTNALDHTAFASASGQRERERERERERILGFPIINGSWCTGDLKRSAFSARSLARGADINIVQYLGIAADEPDRIRKHTKPGIKLPLVDIG